MAVVNLLRNNDDTNKLDIAGIRLRLNDPNCIIKGDAKTTIINLLDGCDENYNQFIKSLERFFNDYMDRVSGWFKLKYQRVMLIISFSVTVLLNVDSVEICNRLWENKNTLSGIAEGIAANKNNIGKQVNTANTYKYKAPAAAENANSNSTEIDKDSVINYSKENLDLIKTLNADLARSGIPMGWTKGNFPDAKDKNWSALILPYLIKLIGWIITTGAVYMGAPFWFDLLSKLVNLRGTGKKPEVSKPTE
jgi:hypothetical protein